MGQTQLDMMIHGLMSPRDYFLLRIVGMCGLRSRVKWYNFQQGMQMLTWHALQNAPLSQLAYYSPPYHPLPFSTLSNTVDTLLCPMIQLGHDKKLSGSGKYSSGL